MREELTEPNLDDPGSAHSSGEPRAFSPPATPELFPSPSANEGLNDRAHTVERGYYVSWDRRSWWNGAAWIPGQPPVTPSGDADRDAPANIVHMFIGLGSLILTVAIALSVCQSMPGGPPSP